MNRLLRFGHRLFAAYRLLPIPVRPGWMIPGTVFLVILLGANFTLPPGPLCDEGMVLFMEGGCDYGYSNIFFFSKLGLLLSISLALWAYARDPRAPWLAFLPHFGVAAWLFAAFWNDHSCDTYYGHPNGNLGQMVLEAAAAAALGIALARSLGPRRWPARTLLVLGWNGLHVGLFYAALALWPHWLWRHTAAVAGCLLLAALALEAKRRAAARG